MIRSSSSRLAAVLTLCAGLVLSMGCVKKSEYEALQARYNEALAKQGTLTETIAIQDEEISALEADFDELTEIFAEELANQELQLEQLVDGIEVEIPSDVMYKSGAAAPTVGSDGLEYAKKLAEFLADTDYFVSVVGHTDKQKVSRALAKKYPTNWELAGARAAGAARFLVANGVDPTHVVASSRGEFDPVASNDTPEGRAKNRRIQIILRSLP
ncbi:MAG: OmpA family protein [Myxococcales bacterium]|nr:OmpA family protein [Myxococcales bacterium]